MPDWWRRRQSPAAPGTITPRQHHPAPRPPAPGPPPPPAIIGERPRWQIERLRNQAAQEHAEYRQDPDYWGTSIDWVRGIADAASWALGELEMAPISRTPTGRGVVPDADLIEVEDDKAEWALRHPREAGTTYSYANGVQHTLMWIGGDTDDCPIGFDD
jgi:hypothetical protein